MARPIHPRMPLLQYGHGVRSKTKKMARKQRDSPRR